MEIELSNGLNHVWQWDPKVAITVVSPADAESVHFRWGGRAVELPLDNHAVDIPPELMQQTRQIRLWAYKPDHTLDVADIPVYPKAKPSDYAYTPTEIKTWEQLDERITALEQGGSVAGVTSVNGKSGTVELTAEDVGAATPEDVASAVNAAAETLQPKGDYITQDGLQSATDAALAQAKASGEFDGAKGDTGDTGPQGPKGNTGDTGPQGPPGADGAGMNITGATVGQIAKIAAVDENGVPTAWVPVDMPSGGSGEWTIHADMAVSEDVAYVEITGLPDDWKLLYILIDQGTKPVYRKLADDSEQAYYVWACAAADIAPDACSCYVYSAKGRRYALVQRTTGKHYCAISAPYVSAGNSGYNASSCAAKTARLALIDFATLTLTGFGAQSANVISAGTQIQIAYWR